MSDYNLNGLGHTEFEHLFQSLLKKVIGAETITFGTGPDGAREATYDGSANFPSTNKWAGKWIFQAKFHNTTHDLSGARKQILLDLKNELTKVIAKYGGHCDNYIFGTNVPLSSVPVTGTHDRIQKIIDEYRKEIPHIVVWGYDDICRLLDNHQDIRHAFLSLILPGDVLSRFFSQNVDHHFNKLKENVILPISIYLENYPYQLPSIEIAKSSAKISANRLTGNPGFDATLIDDFLDNHYPQVRTLWNNLCEYNNKVIEKQNTIAGLINKKIRNTLRKDLYRYLDQEGKYYHFTYEEFEGVLIKSILNCENPCANIHEDSSQPGRIKFNHRIIYLLNEGDSLMDTISRLKILCRYVISSKSIKTQMNGQNGYNAFNQECKETLTAFRDELGIIYNSTNLRVIKNEDGTQKCRLL